MYLDQDLFQLCKLLTSILFRLRYVIFRSFVERFWEKYETFEFKRH